MSKIIYHIADIAIDQESGMGRIAYYWQKEFQKRGYDFVHIGSKDINNRLHPGFFPYQAKQKYLEKKHKASFFLLHEPVAGAFTNMGVPIVLFSHGLERRGWQLQLNGLYGNSKKLSLKTKLLFPLWRLRNCDKGLKAADLLLLSNTEDLEFVQNYYHRSVTDICVFKNGIYDTNIYGNTAPEKFTVIFLGTWLERKGIETLLQAAQILHQKQLDIHWIMAGTGLDAAQVKSYWIPELQDKLKIIPKFSNADEANLLSQSSVFILPSSFEGQPLALLQAMASGKCCITTNCCGQKDLIKHNYNGLLHEPGDHYHLAEYIEACYFNPELVETLGRNAKMSVKDRDWKKVSEDMADKIEKKVLK